MVTICPMQVYGGDMAAVSPKNRNFAPNSTLSPTMNNTELLLLHRDIKPTAVRLLILRALRAAECALSLSDLEARLGTVDKSTIFRSLTLFLSHHLVHAVEDGTGQTKYAACTDDCHCGEDIHAGLTDLHTHFFCERCRRTLCLRGLPIPQVDLPEGFHLHTANYVLKGLCPECARKTHHCGDL